VADCQWSPHRAHHPETILGSRHFDGHNEGGGISPSEIAGRIEDSLRRLANKKLGGKTRAAIELREKLIVVYDTQVFGLEWLKTGVRLFVATPDSLTVSQATEVACKLVGRFQAEFAQLNFPAFGPRGRIRV
jgi:hypothetical protein